MYKHLLQKLPDVSKINTTIPFMYINCKYVNICGK